MSSNHPITDDVRIKPYIREGYLYHYNRETQVYECRTWEIVPATVGFDANTTPIKPEPPEGYVAIFNLYKRGQWSYLEDLSLFPWYIKATGVIEDIPTGVTSVNEELLTKIAPSEASLKLVASGQWFIWFEAGEWKRQREHRGEILYTKDGGYAELIENLREIIPATGTLIPPPPEWRYIVEGGSNFALSYCDKRQQWVKLTNWSNVVVNEKATATSVEYNETTELLPDTLTDATLQGGPFDYETGLFTLNPADAVLRDAKYQLTSTNVIYSIPDYSYNGRLMGDDDKALVLVYREELRAVIRGEVDVLPATPACISYLF